MPLFGFRIVRSFQDSLSRQVAESVRIDLRGEGVLNSKAVYSRNRLPRLEIQKSEWEKADDEKRKSAAEFRMREEQREREKTSLGEGQTVADEVLLSEAWRQGQLGGMVREEMEEDPRPRKKRKVLDTKWGQDAQPEDQTEKFKWLQERIDESDGKREMKQATLQPWSWLKIEARKVLIEIADGIEKRGKEQEAEEKREQCIQEQLEIEIQLEQARHVVVEVEKSVTVH